MKPPRTRAKDAAPGSRRRLRAGILVERRYLSQAQPGGMINALRRRGHHAVVIDPESCSFNAGNERWLTDLDVVVVRGRSWAVLSLLRWAEACEVPAINRRSAIAAVHNKADMAVALRAARLPVPVTLFGSPRELAHRFQRKQYPVILKPVFGDNGNGLRLASDPEELCRIEWPDRVALAQQFLETDGYDLKLYSIGDEVWAVRKPSALAPQARAGQPVLLPVAQPWRRLARRCGDLFGLELFGIDCVVTSQGTVVVEVNEFPNYSGIPEADEKLADYIVRRAREETAS